MGFSQAIRTCMMDKYATFQGRAPRSEYWFFYLFQMLVVAALVVVLFALQGSDAIVDAYSGMLTPVSWVILGLGALFFLATLLPAIAVTVRRLHDRDLSGWWYLVYIVTGMVPVVEWIAVIVFLVVTVMRGTDGENRFGPDPLAEPNTADVFA